MSMMSLCSSNICISTQLLFRSEPGLFKGTEEQFYITQICTTSCWFQTSCWWCLIRECLSYLGFLACLHVFLLPFVTCCSAAAHMKSPIVAFFFFSSTTLTLIVQLILVCVFLMWSSSDNSCSALRFYLSAPARRFLTVIYMSFIHNKMFLCLSFR